MHLHIFVISTRELVFHLANIETFQMGTVGLYLNGSHHVQPPKHLRAMLKSLLLRVDKRNFNFGPECCNQSLPDIAQGIAKAENILVMAGAGMSTPSGIPDFRSPGRKGQCPWNAWLLSRCMCACRTCRLSVFTIAKVVKFWRHLNWVQQKDCYSEFYHFSPSFFTQDLEYTTTWRSTIYRIPRRSSTSATFARIRVPSTLGQKSSFPVSNTSPT